MATRKFYKRTKIVFKRLPVTFCGECSKIIVIRVEVIRLQFDGSVIVYSRTVIIEI